MAISVNKNESKMETNIHVHVPTLNCFLLVVEWHQPTVWDEDWMAEMKCKSGMEEIFSEQIFSISDQLY